MNNEVITNALFNIENVQPYITVEDNPSVKSYHFFGFGLQAHFHLKGKRVPQNLQYF